MQYLSTCIRITEELTDYGFKPALATTSSHCPYMSFRHTFQHLPLQNQPSVLGREFIRMSNVGLNFFLQINKKGISGEVGLRRQWYGFPLVERNYGHESTFS